MKKVVSILVMIFVAATSYAAQNIEIVGGSGVALPKIAIVKFAGEPSLATSVSDIIASDLDVTGEFSVSLYSNPSDIENNTQYILKGSVVNQNTVRYVLSSATPQANGKPNVLLAQEIAFDSSTAGNANVLRKMIHTISNDVYNKLTGTKGIFTSKIAYITRSGHTYHIFVSDYDGYNQIEVLQVSTPLSSLSWSPNGRQVAYVSYISGKPVVYVQDLYAKMRYIVADFHGNNSSPVFTPDGNKLLVTLSKDGDNSHIFMIDNKKYSTDSPAKKIVDFGSYIDTEASVAKDGTVFFSSDHDGGAEIFRTSLSGSAPTLVTANLGNYNVTPRISHDGTKLVFISRNSGMLQAYIMDFMTLASYPININTGMDLSPTFAPNDKLVLYSSDNSLYITNVNATKQTKLNNVVADEIMDQAWSNNF